MTYYATRVQETLSWSPRPKRKDKGKRNSQGGTWHLSKVLFLAQLTAAELLRATPEQLQSCPIQHSLASWSQITSSDIRAEL